MPDSSARGVPAQAHSGRIEGLGRLELAGGWRAGMVNLNRARVKGRGHITLVIPDAQRHLERTVMPSGGA